MLLQTGLISPSQQLQLLMLSQHPTNHIQISSNTQASSFLAAHYFFNAKIKVNHEHLVFLGVPRASTHQNYV
jgi:hypothetical protein